MGSDHDALRARLGPVGVWTFAFDAIDAAAVREGVRAIEAMGFPAVWVPEGGRSREVFAHLSLLLHATERITVCSGIANVTARHAEAMAGGARTLADAFGERVLVGIGIGHQATAGRRRQVWRDPVGRLASYLDEMDAARMGPDPAAPVRRMIAALGPRMLDVAASRTLGRRRTSLRSSTRRSRASAWVPSRSWPSSRR
jgi:probable F420-dependent oxidoreductase